MWRGDETCQDEGTLVLNGRRKPPAEDPLAQEIDEDAGPTMVLESNFKSRLLVVFPCELPCLCPPEVESYGLHAGAWEQGGTGTCCK